MPGHPQLPNSDSANPPPLTGLDWIQEEPALCYRIRRQSIRKEIPLPPRTARVPWRATPNAVAQIVSISPPSPLVGTPSRRCSSRLLAEVGSVAFRMEWRKRQVVEKYLYCPFFVTV